MASPSTTTTATHTATTTTYDDGNIEPTMDDFASPALLVNDDDDDDGLNNQTINGAGHDDEGAPDGHDDHPMTEDDTQSLRHTVRVLSFLFFLGGISASTFGRFAAVFYLSRGLNAFEIGIIEGVMPTVRTVMTPLWGILSDVVRSKKIVSQFCRVMSTLSICMFAFPAVSGTFGRLLIISMCTAAFSGAGSILDAYALEVCGKSSKKLYGRIRLWMAVSWGVGSLVMGIVATLDNKEWTWNFVLYGVFGFVGIVFTQVFVPDRTPTEKQKAAGGTERDWAGLRRMLTTFECLTLLLQAASFGAAIGIIERLMFIFLQNDLGGSPTLCGLAVFTNVLIEIPIFYYAEWIHRRLGHRWMVVLSHATYVVRVMGYTLLTPDTRYGILGLEGLHGLTFALMWLYVVDRSHSLAPAAWLGAMQSVVGSVFACFGVGGGSVIGGYVMHTYGAATLFRGAAVMMAGSLALHLVGWGVAAVRRSWCVTEVDKTETQPLNT